LKDVLRGRGSNEERCTMHAAARSLRTADPGGRVVARAPWLGGHPVAAPDQTPVSAATAMPSNKTGSNA
jgi:hypothetical protein